MNGGSLYTSRDKNILTHIDRARNKYGVESFRYEVLEHIDSPDIESLQNRLNELECYYISKFDSFKNGYNSTEGGEGCLGKEVSENTKMKISLSLTGHSVSQETRNKMSLNYHNNRTGTKHSEESKKLISESRKGKCCKSENGNSKAVICYTKSDELVKEFDSMV